MSTRHTPYWLDRVSKARRPAYPRLRGPLESSVVIVGGGLTGCACAWSFAAAGVKVVLLEAEAIGAAPRREDSGSFARISTRPFRRRPLGARTARRQIVVAGDAAGVARFSGGAAACCEIRVRPCAEDFLIVARAAITGLPTAATRVSESPGCRVGSQLDEVQRCCRARRQSRAAARIRTRGFSLDPYRACLGLACRRGLARRRALRESPGTPDPRRTKAGGGRDRGRQRYVRRQCSSRHCAPAGPARASRHLKPLDGYAVVTESLPAAVRRQVSEAAAGRPTDTERRPTCSVAQGRSSRSFAGADQPAAPGSCTRQGPRFSGRAS